MRRAGFTLLELMISVAVLTVVLGTLFGLSMALGRGARAQEAKLSADDEARIAMMQVVRQIRQAATSSINWSALPGDTLTYSIADDVDGNGTAVDVNGDLELSSSRTLSRDMTDLNGDGATVTQLLMTEGTTIMQPFCSSVLVNEDFNGNGTLDTDEDLNANGVLDVGLWFEQVGRSVRVTLQTQRRGGPDTVLMRTTLVETVLPRN